MQEEPLTLTGSTDALQTDGADFTFHKSYCIASPKYQCPLIPPALSQIITNLGKTVSFKLDTWHPFCENLNEAPATHREAIVELAKLWPCAK